jgi:hypothetical protein
MTLTRSRAAHVTPRFEANPPFRMRELELPRSLRADLLQIFVVHVELESTAEASARNRRPEGFGSWSQLGSCPCPLTLQAINLVESSEVFEGMSVLREAECLLHPQQQEPARTQCGAKEPDHSILKYAIEVNEYIAASHEHHLGESGIRHEAMIREEDVFLEALAEDRTPVGSRVVVGKRSLPAGEEVVLTEAAHAIEVIGAGLGGTQAVGVDVSRVHERSIEQALLREQDGERVRLFACAASGTQMRGDA